MEITTRTLSAFENEILEKIQDDTAARTIRSVAVERKHWDGSGTTTAHVWPAQAIIVWTDNEGVQVGPVRWAHRNSMPGQCDRWSASPFPGAWADVPLSQIVRVRHAEAF